MLLKTGDWALSPVARMWNRKDLLMARRRCEAVCSGMDAVLPHNSYVQLCAECE